MADHDNVEVDVMDMAQALYTDLKASVDPVLLLVAGGNAAIMALSTLLSQVLHLSPDHLQQEFLDDILEQLGVTDEASDVPDLPARVVAVKPKVN